MAPNLWRTYSDMLALWSSSPLMTTPLINPVDTIEEGVHLIKTDDMGHEEWFRSLGGGWGRYGA